MKVSKINNYSLNRCGKNPRDIIPSNFNTIRKTVPIIKNDDTISIKKPKRVKNYIKPSIEFPEWPSKEEVEAFNNSEQDIKWEKFTDPDHDEIFLPLSILEECEGAFKWKRPKEYIIDHYIKKEISLKYPLKSLHKFKKFIYEMYYSDSCPLELKRKKKNDNKKDPNKENYNSENKKLFKLFFKFFEKSDFLIIDKHVPKYDFDIPILTSPENADDEEIFESNKQDLFESKGGSKIQIDEKSSFFNKWISSLLQFLIEFDLKDDGDEPIWKKIYPQRDGIPYYNHNGRYWVKMHHKGKLRKIEIDDLVPCNKEMECLLPKCEVIEELWPIIISKAIIKLFSYKFKFQKNSTFDIGDEQIIHALTGYYVNILDLSDARIDLKKFVKKIDLKISNEEEKDKNFFIFFNKNIIENNDDENKSKDNLSINFNKNNNNNENQKKEKNIVVDNFLNIKKRGTHSSKDLSRVPLETVKISEIILEKNNEILLKKSNIERCIDEKAHNLRRLFFYHKSLLEENANLYFNIRQKTVKETSPKGKSKTIKDFNIKDTSLNLVKILTIRNFEAYDYFEQIKNVPKYLPKKSFTDLNRIFNCIGNENFILVISKEYEEMLDIIHSIKRRARRFTTKKMLNKKDILKTLNEKKKNNISKNSLINVSNSKIYPAGGRNFKSLKKSNNIMYGTCYPVVETFENPGIVKSKFLPIDTNELKEGLVELKSNFRRTVKDEKKEFFDKVSVLVNKFKEKKNKNLKDMQVKGKHKYLFKISNNCEDSPYLRIQCDFQEEEIEIVLKCFLNNWEYPPFEYYKKLSDDNNKLNLLENQKKIKSKESMLNTLEVLSPIKEKKEKESSQNVTSKKKKRISTKLTIDINKDLNKTIEEKENEIMNPPLGNPGENNNIFQMEKEKEIELDNNKEKSSIFNFTPLVGIKNSPEKIEKPKENINNNNINWFLPKNSEINISENYNEPSKKQSSKSFIKKTTMGGTHSFINVCEEVNYLISEEYLWETYNELIGFGNIEKYEKNLKKIKRRNIKGQWTNFDEIKKNFEFLLNIYKYEKLKIKSNFNTLQNWSNEKFNKSDEFHRIYLISLFDPPPVEENPTKDAKGNKIDPKKTALNTNKETKKSNKWIAKINIIKPKAKPIYQSILIEFSANNGKIGDMEEINTFIIFDIYEYTPNNNSQSLDEFNKYNITDSKNSPNLNESSSISIPYKDDKFIFNGDIKLVYKDIKMKGFYATFYNENFEKNKNYLLYIKSSFAPFGYNMKILTENGLVEPMRYDKYLVNYGGMTIAKNLNFNIRNLEANSKFLIGKFLMKIKNPEKLTSIQDYIKRIKKDSIEVRFNIDIQDDYLTQFLRLFIGTKEQEISLKNQTQQKGKGWLPKKNDNLVENTSHCQSRIKDKIYPVNENFTLNLNSYEINDEIIASVILTTPYDISDIQVNVEFICLDNGIISIDVIEIVEPFEILDNNPIRRNNLIFKEILYVSQNVYTTLNISVKKSNKKIKKNELESLKEVSEDSYSSNSENENNQSENLSNVMIKDNQNLEKNLKKNKIRCYLKIYKAQYLIYKIDFYDSVIIPNICFENLIGISKLSQHQYKIQCYVEGDEIPNFLKMNENTLDWKIQVFSSDTVGFVKDTIKEDRENAMKDAWESKEPGRAVKAGNARMKFVEDRKLQIDSYVYENEKDNLHKTQQNLTPNYKSISGLKNQSMDEILANISLLKNTHQKNNSAYQLTNSNTTQQQILETTYLNTLNTTNDRLNETVSMNNRSLLFNTTMNKSLSQKQNQKQNSLVKVATTILIDENLPDLNEKLKKANDFYFTRSNFKDELNSEMDMDFNLDKSRSPVNNRTRISQFGTESKHMHVSSYIKQFLNQTHEDIEDNPDDIFKLKNCLINSKELNETVFSTPVNQKKEVKRRSKNFFNFNNNFGKTYEGSKLKTYCDKLSTQRNFMKTESEKIANMRDTFMKTFNEKYSKEENLYNELVNNFDSKNLDSYIDDYKQLVKNSFGEKLSQTLCDVKSILSFRKDQMISLLLSKRKIKTYVEAQVYYEDIVTNDWKVSPKIIEDLQKIMRKGNLIFG